MEFINSISQHFINISNKLMSGITHVTGLTYLNFLASVVFLALVLEMISSNGRTKVSMFHIFILIGSVYLGGTRGLIFILVVIIPVYIFIKILRPLLKGRKDNKMFAVDNWL